MNPLARRCPALPGQRPTSKEYPMQYTQDALFPDTAVQTSGGAQPEPRVVEGAETETEQFEDAA